SNGSIVPNSGDPFNGLALGSSGFPQSALDRLPASITGDPRVKALFRGIPQGGAQTPWGTHAPRIGFAYDINGKQKTVVRGGFGVFYERTQGNFIFSAINNPPFIQQQTIQSANIDNPTSGTAAAFPASITNSHPVDFKVPRILNWSFGVQHKVDSSTTLDVAYVGSSAASLTRALNINQLRVGTLQANPGINVNALRPYRGYADIQQFVNGANSIYNSLQVQVRRQIKGGGQLSTSYTWSNAITDASGYNEQPMDSYNAKRDRGFTAFDRRHNLLISYVYPLPFWLTGNDWSSLPTAPSATSAATSSAGPAPTIGMPLCRKTSASAKSSPCSSAASSTTPRTTSPGSALAPPSVPATSVRSPALQIPAASSSACVWISNQNWRSSLSPSQSHIPKNAHYGQPPEVQRK
ncbi:MAG: hypothetical protein NTW74_15125, partial [Acidobacteria bacterium]|nr:hypothetical protein [Acidobacteriota bacterium]